jgi:hypothetical protein
MMALLIHYYGVYMASGNPEPEEVSEGTRRYRQNSDGMQMFIDQYMVPDRDESCCADTVFKLFKEFAAHNGLKNCVPGKKPDVMEAMVRHLDGFLLPGGRTLQGARLKDDDELAEAATPAGAGGRKNAAGSSAASAGAASAGAASAGAAESPATGGAESGKTASNGKADGQSIFRQALFDSLRVG